jgi:tetratricopeptide (TPR) repeat protein
MATYKKKDKIAKQLQKDQAKINAESTTKEVFEGLDSGASKAEEWILKNQKPILIVIGAVLVGVLAYMAYMRYVQEPNELKAANELAYPKAYFEQAQANTVVTDSLYTLALEGADGKYGFIGVIENYSNTKAGNLARYYAGISYLKMGEYKKAIEYLDAFSSDDLMLDAEAKANIGDAFADNDQLDEAFKYYEKAANDKPNNFTTPIFLNKAAETAFNIGKFDKSASLYTRLKNEYPKSEFAVDIDGKINRAKYASK